MTKTVLISLFLSLALLGCNKSSDSQSEEPVLPPGPPQTVVTKVFAYSGAQYSNLIHSFELDKATGTLNPTAQGNLATGQILPMVLAASSDKKFLFSINYNSNSISSYGINPENGNLTLVAHFPLVGAAAPAWVLAHPELPIVYVAESGTGKISVHAMDASGNLTLRNSVAAGAGVTALELNRASTVMYSVDQNANEIGIYSVDSLGNLLKVSSVATPAGSSPNHAKLHPNGKFLYVANWALGSVTGYAVNGTSLSLIETVSTGSGGTYLLAPSPDGKYLYASKPYANELVTLNVNPSAGTLLVQAAEAIPGAVNVSFFDRFAFVISWSNAANRPILSRDYLEASGMSAVNLSQTADLQGLYQLLILEIQQPGS